MLKFVKKALMRLSLRKKLRPYRSLKELAEALDLTLPALKRRIRSLEHNGALTVEALTPSSDWEASTDRVYRLFHEAGLCLVCGHEMGEPKDRDIGWGEFKLCPQCDFSAHELANYQTQKETAREQLSEMLRQSRKVESLLKRRAAQSAKLSRAQRACGSRTR